MVDSLVDEGMPQSCLRILKPHEGIDLGFERAEQILSDGVVGGEVDGEGGGCGGEGRVGEEGEELGDEDGDPDCRKGRGGRSAGGKRRIEERRQTRSFLEPREHWRTVEPVQKHNQISSGNQGYKARICDGAMTKDVRCVAPQTSIRGTTAPSSYPPDTW